MARSEKEKLNLAKRQKANELKKVVKLECALEDIKAGAWLRQNRNSLKLSQREIGEMMGLHQTAVSRMEDGKQSMHLSHFIIVCKKMHLSVSETLNQILENDKTNDWKSSRVQNL